MAAITDQKMVIQAKGDEYLPYLSLAVFLASQGGRGDEAGAAYDQARRLKPGLSEAFLRTTWGSLYSPYQEFFLDGLKIFDLPDQ